MTLHFILPNSLPSFIYVPNQWNDWDKDLILFGVPKLEILSIDFIAQKTEALSSGAFELRTEYFPYLRCLRLRKPGNWAKHA
jgi:hypothetical protein